MNKNPAYDAYFTLESLQLEFGCYLNEVRFVGLMITVELIQLTYELVNHTARRKSNCAHYFNRLLN